MKNVLLPLDLAPTASVNDEEPTHKKEDSGIIRISNLQNMQSVEFY